MSAFPDGDHIDMAIGVVGEAKDEALTEQLTDYLMGETDSTPKVNVVLLVQYCIVGKFHRCMLKRFRNDIRTLIFCDQSSLPLP